MCKALYVDVPCKQLLYCRGEDFPALNLAKVTHNGVRLGLKSLPFQGKVALSVAYIHYSKTTFYHPSGENVFMKTSWEIVILLCCPLSHM